MSEGMKSKPGPCPMGETLPLNQDDEPEQITDEELAEQTALHAEFVAAVENDPEFLDSTRRSHAEAQAGKFVTLNDDVLAGLTEETGKPEEFTDEVWARALEVIKEHPELKAEIEQSRAEFAAGKGIPLDELIERMRNKE